MFDLTDAIDLHVHTAPDVYERSVDDHELVRAAAEAGMKAILLKSHHTLTADRAALAGRHANIHVFGGLALNLPVGGINPVAVETAIEFGARKIWMPTLHAEHCLRHAEPRMFRLEAERGRTPLRATNDDGTLRRETLEVLELVRDAGIALGTGHLAPAESLGLLAAARDLGIERLVVTHPNMSFTHFTVDEMKRAASLGALLEFDYLACCPRWEHALDPRETAAAITAVGPHHCILATDGGQSFNPHPVEMLRAFAELLRDEGVSDVAIRRMLCESPARVLGV